MNASHFDSHSTGTSAIHNKHLESVHCLELARRIWLNSKCDFTYLLETRKRSTHLAQKQNISSVEPNSNKAHRWPVSLSLILPVFSRGARSVLSNVPDDVSIDG